MGDSAMPPSLSRSPRRMFARRQLGWGWNQESNFEEFASTLIRRARLAIRREEEASSCLYAFPRRIRRRHSSPRQFESLLMLSSSSSLASCHNFKKAHFCRRRRLKAFLHTKVVVLIPLTIASKSSVVCSILFR